MAQDTGAIYGAERATLDLISLLQPAVEVSVYLIEETRLGLNTSAFREAVEASGAAVTVFPVKRTFSIGLIREVSKAIRRDAVQVLHTVGYKADVHGVWAAGFGRLVPTVSTVHGWLFRNDLKERFYGQVNRWALRRGQRVIALSRHYQVWLQNAGVTPERCVRIPSGFPDPAIVEARPRHDPFVVGMLGRLSEEKCHELLLDVATIGQRDGRDWEYVIAGTGPLEGTLKADVAKRGLSHCVRFIGYQSAADFFASVDVLVMCSRMENLPYVVLEAMAAGVPVVAADVGGLPDLIEPNVTGALFPAGDQSELYAHIVQLAENESLRQAWAREAGLKLKRDFAPDRVREAHVALYRSLCGEGLSGT